MKTLRKRKFDWIFDIDEGEFGQSVVEASKTRPVLVDFWAAWCSPCRRLSPLLEKVAEEFQGAFWLVRVNIQETPSLLRSYPIESIPLVMMFRDGRPVDQFHGLLLEDEVRRFVKRHCSSPADDLVAKGNERLKQGLPGEAKLLFEKALVEEGGNVGALLGLAEVALTAGNLLKVEAHLKMVSIVAPQSERAGNLRARLDFLKQCRQFGGLEETQLLHSENPENLESLFRLACCLASVQSYQQSLEQLLAVVASDRSFRDDGARKAMLEVFRILGDHSPLTEQYRDRLARLVF
jgi:putative thioredoxin